LSSLTGLRVASDVVTEFAKGRTQRASVPAAAGAMSSPQIAGTAKQVTGLFGAHNGADAPKEHL